MATGLVQVGMDHPATTKADIYARRKDVGAAVAQKLGNKPVQAPDSYINPARFRTYAHKGWLTCPTR